LSKDSRTEIGHVPQPIYFSIIVIFEMLLELLVIESEVEIRLQRLADDLQRH
jgi:hypothetical protein